MTHVDVLAYVGGSTHILESIEIKQFKTLPHDKQDLAAALVVKPDLVARAYAWNIPEVAMEVAAGTRVLSYGYPLDGTLFSALRGPIVAECVVQAGSIWYPTLGTNFYADGPWGPGRSGSPVFRIQGDDCILLGVNRGRADVKLPSGVWHSTGWTRIVSVDHLGTLMNAESSTAEQH